MTPSPSAATQTSSQEPAALLAQARSVYAGADYARCGEICGQILARLPGHVAAMQLLGVSLFRRQDYAAAATHLKQALALAPQIAALRLDYAATLSMLHRVDDAVDVLRTGLEHHPADPELSKHLGKFLSSLNRHAEAQAVLSEALRQSPKRVDLLCELAIEYAGDLRFHDALVLLNIANMRQPRNASIQLNIGTVQQALGDLDKAVHHHRQAVSHDPDNPQAHINLAMALLCRFDFAQGFAELEWRHKHVAVARPGTAAPRWHGAPLDGKRILVTVEQGLGDMIQYARFLAPLRTYGGRILLECRPELHRLFAALPGIEACLANPGDPLPEADAAIPLMSLPFVLGCDAGSLGDAIPYLGVPAGPRFDLPPGDGRRIGIVWSSSPGRGALFMRRSLDRRSAPLAALAPIVGVPGAAFYSLQKGEPVTQLADTGLPIENLSARLDDMADTAAAIMELDLVIAVDTSVAHLAAALGKPVWILLAEGQADYRWGIGGERTPWYPAARLFRADRTGWPGLALRVAGALGEWLKVPRRP